MPDKIPNKAKAHIRYHLADGTVVPGVTTILAVLNKPALVKWANNLGLQGIDSSKYRDEMGDIGTLAHQMILDYFRHEKTDTADYTLNQVKAAENCLMSFWNWEKQHDIEVLWAEKPLISSIYGYGGTLDCLCRISGVPTLLDFKTGKAIYPEYYYQVAAYAQLIQEYGETMDSCRILRIGRDADEGFEEQTINNIPRNFEVFEHCLRIYQLQKELRK